jgi:thymidylate synthase ThyX
LLEPFQHIKVIVTATEWENFFKLRIHKDAQPEMCQLATHMAFALDDSTPTKLIAGEWHLPYVEYEEFLDEHECYVEIDKAIKCSVARCARVSYLNHDNSSPDIEKDIALADCLLEAGHMSPFEHQGTPMRPESFNVHAEDGITHIDKYDNLWSGNFRNWIQHRQLLSAV